jgi:hypothetical protein
MVSFALKINLLLLLSILYLRAMTAEDYEAAFYGIQLPEGPIEIGQGAIVKDVPLFVEKELAILKFGNNERVKEPVRWRLNRLIELINENNQ